MNKYMMATKAYHKMGDISSDVPELCIVHGPIQYPSSVDVIFGPETKIMSGDTELPEGDYYVGSWVEGFGFFNVRFPVETTRPLTEAEIVQYEKGYYQLANHEPQKMHIRDFT